MTYFYYYYYYRLLTISPSYVRHSWKTRSKKTLVNVPVPYLASSCLLSIPLWSLSRLRYWPEREEYIMLNATCELSSNQTGFTIKCKITSYCKIRIFQSNAVNTEQILFCSEAKNKNVSGFWSPRKLRQTSALAFLVFSFCAMKRCPIAAKIVGSIGILPCSVLTTSRRLTCIHTKLFPTVKRRTCIHVLRHYSRNSYSRNS